MSEVSESSRGARLASSTAGSGIRRRGTPRGIGPAAAGPPPLSRRCGRSAPTPSVPHSHPGSVGIVHDIGHIVLPVDEMEKALSFYRDLLGLRVVGKGSPVWTVIETEGGQLTLWRTTEIPKVALGPNGDASPFEFHVDNFEIAASALESKGIR